jgi:hypothetical protein
MSEHYLLTKSYLPINHLFNYLIIENICFTFLKPKKS